jgi:hypothetical protein
MAIKYLCLITLAPALTLSLSKIFRIQTRLENFFFWTSPALVLSRPFSWICPSCSCLHRKAAIWQLHQPERQIVRPPPQVPPSHWRRRSLVVSLQQCSAPVSTHCCQEFCSIRPNPNTMDSAEPPNFYHSRLIFPFARLHQILVKLLGLILV